MARPSGYVARFHYKKHWISNSVLSHLPEKGSLATVVFCDLEHPGAIQFSYYPLLTAEVVAIEPAADSSFLRPEDYVAVVFRTVGVLGVCPYTWDRFAGAWEQAISARTERPFPREAGRNSKFLFEIDRAPDDLGGDETLSWQTHCSRLKETRTLADSEFFKFTGIFKCSNPFEVPKTSPEKPNNDVYELRSNKTYIVQLQLLNTPGSEKLAELIEPKARYRDLHISRPIEYDVGRLSTAAILLRAPRLFDDQHDVLTFEALHSKNRRVPRFGVLKLPIVIRPDRRALLLPSLVIFAGLVLTGVSSELVNELSNYQGAFYDHNELFCLLARVIGISLTAIGAFWGFRSLPGLKLG